MTMSFVGEFREGEINGKPFHIFTILPQTDVPTSSSNLSVQPLFLCPDARYQLESLRRRESGYGSIDDSIPFQTSPFFPNVESADQQVQSLLDSGSCCKDPVAPLFWCYDKTGTFNGCFCFSCQTSHAGTNYDYCVTCNTKFHRECVECPSFIKHPSYPFLSLQLYSCRFTRDHTWICFSCEDRIFQNFYYCPIYNLVMHPFCALQPVPIFIDHPKRHPHSLTFFPKQNSLPCNICGVIKQLIPTYVCARCVFVVHQDCIYFPYVIRICRHPHRISFTSSLPSGDWSCGVCRREIVNDCGAYSCNKCPNYFVHSRCATRKDLWDGIELEGVPEEPEIVVEPFVTIADGIILHFSHGHHLKLEICGVYDDDKFCQACVLPIYEGNFYSCLDQCDFILHEKCANSPLKKHHPLYALSLTLKVVTNGYNDEGGFRCSACSRRSCGFVYEDSQDSQDGFKLDVRCASISEPVNYEGHAHPLFLALTSEEEKSAICQICKDYESSNTRKLNCIICEYIICFECATIPYKARYKHDKHSLTFREGKESSDQSGWCEVCEMKIDYSKTRGLYACDDYCCTTLHDACLLGTEPYMKPGQTIDIGAEKVHVLRNSTMSRPRCHYEHCPYPSDKHRCLYRVVFEIENMKLCSYYCASAYAAFK